MIKISNLNKYFNKGKKNELHVLKDISYTFPDTGLVSILGESGSGKSTLINIIGGLLYHNEDIVIDDKIFNNKNISELEEYRNNNIGYIFQSYLVYKDLSVYDNLKISLNVLNIFDEDEIDARIDYVLNILNLTKYKKKKASELSGGEQQRLSIARALIKKCKIYICDEPTGNLDTKNSINVMNILKVLSKDALVILVTHNVSLANTYSDTVIHMIDGRFTDIKLESKMVDVNNVNDIYLEDFNCTTYGDSNVKINYYNNNYDDVEINIIVKDNKLYISGKTLEVISNAKVYEKRETFVNQLNDFKYDNSFFQDKKTNDIPFYKLLINALFRSKSKSKKEKVLGKTNILLSIVLMILLFMSSFSITTLVNINRNYEKHTIMVYNEGYVEDRISAILEMKEKGIIKNIDVDNDVILEISYYNLPNYSTDIMLGASLLRLSDNVELLAGSFTDNGVIIGEEIYKTYFRSENIPFNRVIDKTVGIKIAGTMYVTTITGIKKGGRNIYYRPKFYESLHEKAYNVYDINDYKTYKVIEEVESDYKLYVEKETGLVVGELLPRTPYIITGIIENDPNISNLAITNIGGFEYDYYHFTNYNDLYEDDIVLISGTKPTKLFDVVVPSNTSHKLGDTVSICGYEFNVVGIYDPTKTGKYTYLMTEEAVSITFSGHFNFYRYEVCDQEAHDQIVNSKGILTKTDKEMMINSLLPYGSLLLISIFTFFIILNILLMFIINRVKFYDNKEAFLILRSISGNRNYIKKRYLSNVIVTNIKYMVLPMLFLYFMSVYITINTVSFSIVTNVFLYTLLILVISSILINYLYISNQLRREPLYLERKYDL